MTLPATRTNCLAGVLAALLMVATQAGAQGLAAARSDARAGRVDAALADLAGLPSSYETELLRCSLWTSIEHRDRAVAACEAAAKAAPQSSAAALALARAYGDKAGHSGTFTGMRMVGKIRDAFERAVALDGNNVDALSDLGQFDVEAPGIVGGGTDKARALVERLRPLSTARAYRLAGMIAVKNKDDATAQREFAAELAVAHTPEAYVDMANFLRGRKDYEGAANNARAALQHDTHHGPDSLDAAGILLDMKRDVPAAQNALRAYLDTPHTDTVAGYAHAHVMLGRSLKSEGKTVEAQAEFNAALALAHDYDAAREELSR